MLSLNQPHDFQKWISKEHEVFTSPAWHGALLGLECEEFLRGKPTGSYILRCGEARFHYYLSYVLDAPFTYKHQPFSIATDNSTLGWGYKNGHIWWAPTIEKLIPLVLHKSQEECLPLAKPKNA